MTPLHLAVSEGYVDIVGVLLTHGAETLTLAEQSWSAQNLWHHWHFSHIVCATFLYQ